MKTRISGMVTQAHVSLMTLNLVAHKIRIVLERKKQILYTLSMVRNKRTRENFHKPLLPFGEACRCFITGKKENIRNVKNGNKGSNISKHAWSK